MAYTDGQNETLELVSIICSTFSISGGLFIILTYVMFAKMKRMAYQLVLFVAISDLIRSIGNVFGRPDEEFLCSLQGFLKNFGGLSSFLWILTIAMVMYSILFYSHLWQNPNLKQRLIIMSSSIYSVAFILSSLPLIYEEYIQLSAWCWISNVNQGTALRWLSFYGWLLFVFFTLCILYGIMFWKIRDTEIKRRDSDRAANSPNEADASEDGNGKRKETTQSKREKMFDRIKYYPIVLLLCYTFGVIRRLINAFDDTVEIPYFIAFLHVFLSSLYGLANSIVYGLTPRVKKEWKKKIQVWRVAIFGVDIMKGGTTDNEMNENGRKNTEKSHTAGTDVSTY